MQVAERRAVRSFMKTMDDSYIGRCDEDKLETSVDFPIDDFDLSNYTTHKNSQLSFRYKLYGISNHYGRIGGGHYTAFVQKPIHSDVIEAM
ncbi:ubiquitin specific protease domain protein [Tanacetum coccineum]